MLKFLVAGLMLGCGARSERVVNVAQPAPPVATVTVEETSPEIPVFANVYFSLDSSRLSKDALAVIDENAALLEAHADLDIAIEGHADPRGSSAYNLALSERRAKAVVAALKERGVAEDRITFVAKGETERASTDRGEAAWALDRRAVFRVVLPKDAVAAVRASGTTPGA